MQEVVVAARPAESPGLSNSANNEKRSGDIGVTSWWAKGKGFRLTTLTVRVCKPATHELDYPPDPTPHK